MSLFVLYQIIRTHFSNLPLTPCDNMFNEICVMCSGCDLVTFTIIVNSKEASTKYLLTSFSPLSSAKRSKEKWLLIYSELHYNNMPLNKREEGIAEATIIFGRHLVKILFDVAYSSSIKMADNISSY